MGPEADKLSAFTLCMVTHLKHPVFAKLLEKAAKECGLDSNDRLLFAPCDESEFKEAL